VDKTLKSIENEINWLIKDYKSTTDYQSNRFLETLNYHIIYEAKRIKLTFQFIFMPIEASLSLKLIYELRDKQKEPVIHEFPFSKIRSGQSFPMINQYDYQRIHDVMDYEIVDGQIKSCVSTLTQGLTYTEVIRRNIKEMIKFGRELRKSETVF